MTFCGKIVKHLKHYFTHKTLNTKPMYIIKTPWLRVECFVGEIMSLVFNLYTRAKLLLNKKLISQFTVLTNNLSFKSNMIISKLTN